MTIKSIEEAREIIRFVESGMATIEMARMAYFGAGESGLDYYKAKGFLLGWKARGEKDMEIVKDGITRGLGRMATKTLVAMAEEIQKLDEVKPSGSQEEGN